MLENMYRQFGFMKLLLEIDITQMMLNVKVIIIYFFKQCLPIFSSAFCDNSCMNSVSIHKRL